MTAIDSMHAYGGECAWLSCMPSVQMCIVYQELRVFTWYVPMRGIWVKCCDASEVNAQHMLRMAP